MSAAIIRPAYVSAFLLWALVSLTIPGGLPAQTTEITDAELSDLVKKAFVYAFPVYEMYRTRYAEVYDPGNPDRTDLNRFHHRRKLLDHTARLITTPNNDTLYSFAWLDLAEEPLVLSVPDFTGRYYSMAFMDFYTNNFAYVGRRTTGTKRGDYLVVGPNWNGAPPQGMPIIKSPTNAVWLLGRILVDDEADLPNVHKLQDQCKLTPLSVWAKTDEAKSKTGLKNPPPAPDPKDPWSFFKIVNLALTENPPPRDEAALMAEFAKIGVGPNQSLEPSRFSEHQQKLVLGAVETARKEIVAGMSRWAIVRQGWSYTRPNIGNYGKDYEYRALIALIGLAAMERAEAVYVTARTDKEGNPLSGKNRYRLRFEKGALPPVDAFWSLSMYEVMPDQRGFFVDNPIRRYAIGDRTKGLKYSADGSLEIYMQHQSPGKDLEFNWLPTPPGVFRVTFRAYQPGERILKGDYWLPGIERVE